MKAERSPVCPSNPLRGLVRYGQTLTKCLKSFRVCTKRSDCEFEDNQVLGSRVAADQKASIGPHRPFSPMYRLGTKPPLPSGCTGTPGRAGTCSSGGRRGQQRTAAKVTAVSRRRLVGHKSMGEEASPLTLLPHQLFYPGSRKSVIPRIPQLRE